jgi:hypothetical protein
MIDNIDIDMTTIKSPEKKDLQRATDMANRLGRQPCNYVYRYERDEIAKLLENLVNFVDQTESLVAQYCKDHTEQNEFIEGLKKKIKEAQDQIRESHEEIERQKKLQALYAKFGKRNMQQLIAFLEGEFQSKGYELLIDSDEFETQFYKYISYLPQPDVEFLTTEFAKLKSLDRSADSERDLDPFHTPTISPVVPVIGDGKHIGSGKNYDK